MRTLILVTLLGLCAGSADAQRRRNEREGFWFGFGLGPGSMGTECATCTNNRANGAAGYLRLGGTFSQSFLLGAELGWWAITVNGVEQTMAAPTISAFYYPSRRGSLYLKLGVGGLGYRNRAGSTELNDMGGALAVGIGWEARIARNASLVPYFNAYASGKVDRDINGTPIANTTGLTRNMVQFGLGLTFH